MNEKVVEFLKSRPALNLNQLEIEAGLPQSLISKVMKGKRKFNEKHLARLIPILERYGFSKD